MAKKGDLISWVQYDRYTWISRQDIQWTYRGAQNLEKKEQGGEHKDIKKCPTDQQLTQPCIQSGSRRYILGELLGVQLSEAIPSVQNCYTRLIREYGTSSTYLLSWCP